MTRESKPAAVSPNAAAFVEPRALDQLVAAVTEARAQTLALVEDLADPPVAVPLIETVNPFLWELGHVAYFQELFLLRRGLGQAPFDPAFDDLFDSASVGHESRFSLDLPGLPRLRAYLDTTRDRVLDALAPSRVTPEAAYLATYSVFHEDMHAEAFTYTRQALGLPPPLV